MLTLARFHVLLFSIVAVGTACAPEDTFSEFADESDQRDDGAGKFDSPAGENYDYFTVRRDVRRCAYPLCGGYWVSRVNRTSTRCADGSYQTDCYVPELSTEAVGLDGAGSQRLEEALLAARALLRGAIASREFGADGNLGEFLASEAWVGGAESEAQGTFVRLIHNDIACITAPCPTIREQKLNSRQETDIAGVDFGPANASQEAID